VSDLDVMTTWRDAEKGLRETVQAERDALKARVSELEATANYGKGVIAELADRGMIRITTERDALAAHAKLKEAQFADVVHRMRRVEDDNRRLEAERDALKARVAELERMEMFTRCQHTCATSGCTETGVSGICGKCTVTTLHERDALAAKLADGYLQMVEARLATVEAKLAIAVEALTEIERSRRGLEMGMTDDERAEHWSYYALRYREMAREALAKLGEK